MTQREELKYSLFHKTLPRSCLQMHLISVRFYEMGDTQNLREEKNNYIQESPYRFHAIPKPALRMRVW